MLSSSAASAPTRNNMAAAVDGCIPAGSAQESSTATATAAAPASDERQMSRWIDRSRHARYRLALFNSIFEEAEPRRAQAIDSIVSIVRTWVAQIIHHSQAADAATDDCRPRGKSSSTDIQAESDAVAASRGDIDDEAGGLNEARELLSTNLLVILRMSHNCPFEDVRRRFTQLLGECRAAGVSIPRPSHASPSFFIPASRVVQIVEDDAMTRRMMTSTFILNGRFSHVYRLMIYFPAYLETHARSYNQIMRHQGPLPRHWRNYIAIMAASQHACQYLVSLQTNEFLQNGGDAAWLQGLAWTPLKLRNLATINTLLAHQPWRLGKQHIEDLLRGAENWSKSELVQAIVVLSTFHSLSSFVMGCGVVPEIDMPGGTKDELVDGVDLNSPSVPSPLDEDVVDHTAQLIHRLKGQDTAAKVKAEAAAADQSEIFANCENQETFHVGGMNGDGSAAYANGFNGCTAADDDSQSGNLLFEDLSRFLGQDEIRHVDFDYKSSDYSVFRLQDYNWEEHGCPMISKFLPETGELIDQEFSAILNLTDYSLFDTREQVGTGNVDTWPFRQAIWYYVLRLFGLSHDDYDYHEVNIYLNKRIKQYIKKVACYPEKIVPADFHRMGFTFRPDEKCQINLLASEARKCAELVYALSALTKCDR